MSGSATSALRSLLEGVDAVVSLCRVGDTDLLARAEQIDVRLIDRQGVNGNLDFVLLDTVRLVEQLRREGRTVPIHCVHARLAHLAPKTYSWWKAWPSGRSECESAPSL